MWQDICKFDRLTASFEAGEDSSVFSRRIDRIRVAIRTILAAAVLWAVGPTHLVAAAKWLTGSELQRTLKRPVSVTWTGRAYRDALSTLSDEYQVATLLDRRVDPGRVVKLSIADQPLNDLLEELAKSQQTSVAWVGSVAYFGPTEKVRQLRTLVAIRQAEARGLPAEVRRDVMRQRPLEWEELTTPRELLERVAERCSMSIRNIEQLPHDLWAAGTLPPLNVVQTLALLGVGFDVTFKIDGDGKTIGIEALPARITIDRFYAPDSGGLETWVARLKRVAPQSLVKPHRGQIAVRGRIEDHERIAAAMRGEKVGPPTRPPNAGKQAADAQKVYSLKVTAPLAQLLPALGRQAGFEVRMKSAAIAEAKIDLQQIVAVDVKDASLAELLREVLRPAGLAFRQEEGVVVVFPATE